MPDEVALMVAAAVTLPVGFFPTKLCTEELATAPFGDRAGFPDAAMDEIFSAICSSVCLSSS